MRRPAPPCPCSPEDDAWVEGRSLVETVRDIELVDPELSSERLAYRLFHERGVQVFRATPVKAQCSCSRHNVENMLKSFSQQDRDDMVEDGRIKVTCEFCSSIYVFTPDEVAAQDAGNIRSDRRLLQIRRVRRSERLVRCPRILSTSSLLRKGRVELGRNRRPPAKADAAYLSTVASG